MYPILGIIRNICIFTYSKKIIFFDNLLVLDLVGVGPLLLLMLSHKARLYLKMSQAD